MNRKIIYIQGEKKKKIKRGKTYTVWNKKYENMEREKGVNQKNRELEKNYVAKYGKS